MRNFLSRLSVALLAPLHKIAVMVLGLYTLLWGLWVASPFWDVFTQASLYSSLMNIAPEWAWGLLAVLCGSAIIWGAARESYRSLAIGAHVSWGHWLIIAIFYFAGDWQNTGGITSLAISIYSALIYLNMRVNCKKRHIKMHDIFS